MQRRTGWPSIANLSRQPRSDGLPVGQGLRASGLKLMLTLEHGLVHAPLLLFQVRRQPLAQFTQLMAAQYLAVNPLALLGMQLPQHPHPPAGCSAAALGARSAAF